MIRPIIVIGMNRSGTKWVSNLICSHEDVIGVQSRRTGGILETNMFDAMPEKFDLAYPDDYIGLIELWSTTEFFRRVGIDKEIFYKLSPRPRNALQLFELLMNELARRHGKKHWLQKTQPENAARVLEYFTNARIVVIRRDLLDNMRSTVGLQKKHGVSPNLFRATYRYVYQAKLLKRLCNRHPVIEMRYETLKADPMREKARLFAELDLNPVSASGEGAFPKNTSFTSHEQRQQILPPYSRLSVPCLAWTINLLPLPVISAAMKLWGLFRGRKPRPLVGDTFGELGDELADRSRG